MGLKRYFIDGKERIFEIKSCIKNYKFKIWEVTYFNSEKAYKYSFDRIFEVDYKNDVFEYLRELSKNKKMETISLHNYFEKYPRPIIKIQIFINI